MKRMTLNAAELDKYIILTGYFHFQTEVLEKVLEDELYGKLYRELQFCAENTTSKGVLITDTYSNALYIGTIFDDNSMQLINFYNNQADIIDINIALDNQLNITKETETFISEDNVKTLFGNQSIIGTGNIDLYRHELIFRGNNNTSTITLTYYSSNKLPVDSAQDLTTITKAVNKTFIACTGFNDQDQILLGGNGICFENNVWKFGYCYYDQGTAQFNGLFNLEEFHDNVTSI